MSLPPSIKRTTPPVPKLKPRAGGLIQGLAADPFDTRFHEGGRYREHTLLGLMLETYARSKLHPAECKEPVMVLTIRAIENLLRDQCPDALQEIENHV